MACHRFTVFLLDDHEIVRRGLRDLLEHDVEVSLLFRSHTPVAKRSPSTEQLASMLNIRGHREELLRANISDKPPPAIYEYSGQAQLAKLFATGWFHCVLVFFWFWRDTSMP